MIEDNVSVVPGNGENCFVCETPIARNEAAIEVAFNVSILGITSKRMVEKMHLECAMRLRAVLDTRIRQAEDLWKRL